jgi:predicted dehydrogenase
LDTIRRVKTAVIGCGMISNIYIKNIKHQFSIIDLIACCDIDEAKAKEKAEMYSISQVLTLNEVARSKEIELVINLTAPFTHYDIIKKLLLSGKNVFTEKMLCLDINHGKELVALARENNLYLGVAPDTFLGAGLQTARKIIDSGLIGEITSCLAAINRNQPISSELFDYIKYKGGGFPFDIGTYYITALLSLLGPVKKIAGFTVNLNPLRKGTLINKGTFGKEWTFESKNLMTGILEFHSGVLGNIHFDGESIMDEQPHIAIYGTEGILYLGNPNNFNGYVKLLRKGCGFDSLEKAVEIPFTHGYSDVPVGGEPGPFDWGQQRGVGAAEMAWSMRKGRKNRASAELGLHTVELLCGMDISSDTNKTYEMTTSFELPRALPSGFLAMEAGLPLFTMDSEIALTF